MNARVISSELLNKSNKKSSKDFNNETPISKNFLSLPKQNRNMLCLSPHIKNDNSKQINRSALGVGPANNISSFQKDIIQEKIEQYKLHPFRRLNLKLVGENIKHKLIEMNEENGYEKEKTLSSPTERRQFSKLLKENYNLNETISNLNFSFTDETRERQRKSANFDQSPTLEFFEKYKETKDKTDKGPGSHVINLKIPKTKKKADNKNNEVEKNNSKICTKMQTKSSKSINYKYDDKHRKLKKIKILYDSMDDNESDEEIEGEVINPESKFILIFDLLIIILYIFTFLPVTINLLKTECFCSSNKTSFNDIIFYFNDLLFISDLIISFFRGYYNFEYKLIKINRLIIKNYLLGDFFLDFLEAIPFFTINKYICWNNYNYFNCYKYEMPSKLFFLKMALILKILKIIKILGIKKNQALDNFLELISENYAMERATFLAIDSLIFIGIFHCFVCFHIFIGKHTYSNWILRTGAQNESIFYVYIESLYFLITTLTTVGYGDIVCNSFGERLFHILLLAVGSIFYSYIISTIGNYIKNDSHAKITLNNNLNILENIRIAYPHMPFKLYKNVRKYLESKSNSQEKNDVNSLIDTLPFTLKNTILFTMYKSVIKNFKFFKKNDNSEFIAQVLTNFIQVISKKNEFLVYEGEMLEEIIFIKDGRISLNAAINLEDPSTSLCEYFKKKFSPFTSDEEKKIFGSNIIDYNNLNKSVYVSTMNPEISYDTAQTKIKNAFNTLNKNNEDNFVINNTDKEKNNPSDLLKFDINGGVIKNEDGTYQYLKIMDIRKNEHFGCVFMTLKIPCPLTLQVKSKFAEIFLLKKEDAVATSKSYPNIWKKLYGKEFHNLTSIKDLTFKALKKYMELNQLLLDLNLDDHMGKNDLTVNDLNEIEKSLLTDKSFAVNSLFLQSKKSISQKRNLLSNNFTRFKTVNSEFDKKQKKRLSLEGIYVQNNKDKISSLRNRFKRGNVTSNSIIYSNKNKDIFLKLESLGSNNNPMLSSKKLKRSRMVHFADDIIFNRSNKNEIENNNFSSMKKISSIGFLYTEENDSEKKMAMANKKSRKNEKLRKLKRILEKCKERLKMRKYEELRAKKAIPNEKKNEIPSPNFQPKKTNLKKKSNNQTKPDLKYQINIISENQVITNINNVESNDNKNIVDNNFNKINPNVVINECEDSLIKDLNNFCNEENNFSFLSIDNLNNYSNLSICKDIDFEIISSYENINQISKGKYIFDYQAQSKFKFKIKNYFIKKIGKENELTLSLKSIHLSSSDSNRNLKINQKKSKKSQKVSEKGKKSAKSLKKSDIKNISKSNKSKSNKTMKKENKEAKLKLKENKPEYETDIKFKNNMKINSSKRNNESNKLTLYNINTNNSTNQNNFTFCPSSAIVENNEQNSIKVNASSIENKTLSFSKKVTKKLSQNDSLDINITKKKHIYNESEAEYEIEGTYSKSNVIYDNNPINHKNLDENSNKNINIINYKIKKGNNINIKNKDRKIIDQLLGIKLPNANIITNNITTTSSKDINNKDNFNTNEKINNIEASFSIYNIIQKNINKNLNIIDNKENIGPNDKNKSFCNIF